MHVQYAHMSMGSSSILGAIWKFLKIALPVKLAEQWNLILFYWSYKRIVLELLYVSDTSQFLPKLYKYHWWTPETHIYILYQGSNLQYSAISPRKKGSTVLCTTATYIGALATSFIWKSLAKVPQNLLLLLNYVHESGISENTQKRQTSIPKSIIPEWADNFFCQYAANKSLAFFQTTVTQQTYPALAE